MRRPLLVLVRWKGDIVATYDDVPTAAPLVSNDDGVRVEVYDVEAERDAAVRKRRIEWRPVAGVLASFLLHAAIGAGVLLALRNRGEKDIDAEANQKGALIQDYLTRIAANENTAVPVEPPREPQHEETPPINPQAKPTPAPPPVPSVPPPPKPSHAKPDPLARPSDVTSQGAGGHDASSTSPSVCNATHVGPSSGPMCHRNVVIGSIAKRASCYVDTVANAGDQGTLTYPCAGDGAATLTFGSRSFAGAVVGGKVDVCTGTEYPFSDGCTWSSAQRVSGSLSSGTLRFTYGEAPKPGQDSCAQACGATATLRVQGSPIDRTDPSDTSL